MADNDYFICYKDSLVKYLSFECDIYVLYFCLVHKIVHKWSIVLWNTIIVTIFSSMITQFQFHLKYIDIC